MLMDWVLYTHANLTNLLTHKPYQLAHTPSFTQYLVLEKSATKATDSSGGSSLTYHELSSIATHLDEPTFKKFMGSHLHLQTSQFQRNQSGSSTTKSESRLKSLLSLTRSVSSETSGPNARRITTAITREEIIRKLRELECNSLAAALEAGNVKNSL